MKNNQTPGLKQIIKRLTTSRKAAIMVPVYIPTNRQQRGIQKLF